MSLDSILAKAAKAGLAKISNLVTISRVDGTTALVSGRKELDLEQVDESGSIYAVDTVYHFNVAEVGQLNNGDMVKEDLEDTTRWWEVQRPVANDGYVSTYAVIKYVSG